VMFEFEFMTFQFLPLSLLRLKNHVYLSCGVQMTDAA
jgi:hypothetical protein